MGGYLPTTYYLRRASYLASCYLLPCCVLVTHVRDLRAPPMQVASKVEERILDCLVGTTNIQVAEYTPCMHAPPARMHPLHACTYTTRVVRCLGADRSPRCAGRR